LNKFRKVFYISCGVIGGVALILNIGVTMTLGDYENVIVDSPYSEGIDREEEKEHKPVIGMNEDYINLTGWSTADKFVKWVEPVEKKAKEYTWHVRCISETTEIVNKVKTENNKVVEIIEGVERYNKQKCINYENMMEVGYYEKR
jgi:hypothetical protein